MSSTLVSKILYPELFVEEVISEEKDSPKTSSVIRELISTSWSGDNDSQMKAVQLLKGVALSEDDIANKFMKALDKFTTGMNAEDYT